MVYDDSLTPVSEEQDRALEDSGYQIVTDQHFERLFVTATLASLRMPGAIKR